MTNEQDIPYLAIFPGMREATQCVAHLPDFTSPRFWPRLREVVEAVVGDPCEHVNVFWAFPGDGTASYHDLFVNEMGQMRSLPRNELATRIYRNNVLTHDPLRFPTPEALPWIAGPAVLFRDRVWR
ncbi:hypothetical protein V3589_14865 [Sinorhizobium fredii]|uniref:hypothetical protein n=1 Tax=Rhizobium fredii TaxID=380 RepID=UPI00309DEC58